LLALAFRLPQALRRMRIMLSLLGGGSSAGVD
jgi:hypothetical protein